MNKTYLVMIYVRARLPMGSKICRGKNILEKKKKTYQISAKAGRLVKSAISWTEE